ncbi:uncharacterized protein LOC128239034 [Mya arenaria]|uniref:uncharacterized protein LOC128239034 n=1 Tax=Mya arenaria TaxID=6604 RepID=UPI0022E82603|nr:uncharacterized protein LOC128239034 [Mya arenaria]
MFTTGNKRIHTRKLGQYVPESRIELHAEKVLFRNQSSLLRELCDKQTRHKRRQQFQFSDDYRENPTIQSLFQRTSVSQHAHAQQSHVTGSTISPEVRWLLTRSARLQRINNAGYSSFHNRIKDKVVSADGRNREISLVRQRSMCYRNERAETPRQQRLQCDVLGPQFCTDCTEIGEKVHIMKKEQEKFPRIEVHTRSLVAPEKVEKMYLSNPKELFHQKKRYACGCTYDPKLEITTPLVYTPHEVFQRIRRRNQKNQYSEKGGTVDHTHAVDTPKTKKDKQIVVNVQDEHVKAIEARPSFVQEKTEPPMDMKVSVKFVNEG